MVGGSNYKVVFIPERKGESRVMLANRSKAENILGWFPKRNLEEYLRGKIV